MTMCSSLRIVSKVYTYLLINLPLETKNELNDDDPEGFQGIKVVQGFETASLDLLRYLKESVSAGSVQYPDYFEALIAATDMMIKHTGSKKYDRKIILFTDASAPLDIQGIEEIKAELDSHQIILQVIGFPLKEMEANVQRARNALKFMAEDSGGSVITIDYALDILSQFRSKSTRIMTSFRGNLEIGSSLQIPIYLYAKSNERKLPSAKKAAPEPTTDSSNAKTTNEVEMCISHVLMDESNTTVDAGDIVKVYRYGKTLIPFDSITSSSVEIDCTKSLKVISFVPAASIKREMSMGGVSVIVADSSSGGGGDSVDVALSAFIQAMYQKDLWAIARYVRASNSSPKLVCLSPKIREGYECLVMSILPFAEDVRNFGFSQLSPSSRNASLLDTFIDNMDLCSFLGTDDDNCENDEL